MPDIPFLLLLTILLALVFDYTNGAHDSANAIASVVSTRVMGPKSAVLMAGLLNFAGAFLGTNVAETIGKGIVKPEMISGTGTILLAAVIGAIFWNILTWYLGIPSSSSHALIGGLMGAGIIHSGWNSLEYASITRKVILPLFLSPVAGFIAGYAIMQLLVRVSKGARFRPANVVFKKLQVVSAASMALSHGMNDAQKSMGIITLALLLFHQIPELVIPVWVKIACASAIMFGTVNGGWKIIKTMGQKIFKMQPIHGFAMQSTTAGIILGGSLLGAPISTTQVISASVLGVGSSKRFSAVRWGVAGNMVLAWIITIPASAAVGGLCMFICIKLGLG